MSFCCQFNLLFVCYLQLAAHKVENPAYSFRGFNWLGGCDRSNFEPSSTRENGDSARKPPRSSTLAPSGGPSAAPLSTTKEYYTGSSSSGCADPLQAHRLHQVCSKMNQLLKDRDIRAQLHATAHNTCEAGDNSTTSNVITDNITSVAVAGTADARQVDISIGVRWRNLCRDLLMLSEEAVSLQAVQLFHLGLVSHDSFFNIKGAEREEVWANFLDVQQVRLNLMRAGDIFPCD